MVWSKRNLLRGGLWASLVALPAVLVAAERRTAPRGRDVGADDKTVEMFAAIESKEIEVKLIPQDVTKARVLIKNLTDQPLNVRLPQAFAGVPVLAQRAGGGGGVGGGGGGNNSANQSMGGGMGGMGMGGMGMGGGMMNIAPEKVAQFKVPIVCLEHGKKDPRPVVPYEIRPIETVTTNPGVKQLLVAMGQHRLNQQAAQAAAWHLANNMSWQELASKQIEHINGVNEQWFSVSEIQAGIQLAEYARQQARQEELASSSTASPGDRDATIEEVISKTE